LVAPPVVGAVRPIDPLTSTTNSRTLPADSGSDTQPEQALSGLVMRSATFVGSRAADKPSGVSSAQCTTVPLGPTAVEYAAPADDPGPVDTPEPLPPEKIDEVPPLDEFPSSSAPCFAQATKARRHAEWTKAVLVNMGGITFPGSVVGRSASKFKPYRCVPPETQMAQVGD